MLNPNTYTSPGGRTVLLNKNGNTRDIMAAVAMGDKLGHCQVMEYAQSIPGDDLQTLCYNIWKSIKDTVLYKEDAEGFQLIQLPSALYANRKKELGGTGKGGDCKSMSLTAASILKALGIPCAYRFVTEKAGEDYHHVYVVVPTGNGGEYITVDATLPDFDRELGIAEYEDMQAVAAPCGISGPRNAAIGDGVDDYTGNPQLTALVPANWVEYENEWKKTYKQRLQNARASIRARIDAAYPGWEAASITAFTFLIAAGQASADLHRMAEERKNLIRFFTDDDGLIAWADVLMYAYWNDYYPSVNGAYPQLTISGDRIAKRQKSLQKQVKILTAGRKEGPPAYFTAEDKADIQALQAIPIITPEELETFVDVATYVRYGVSLRCMLNKCYNMERYGVVYTPKECIPYYGHNKAIGETTDAWKIIGPDCSPGEALVKIAMVQFTLPYWNGTGKWSSVPWGQPYWCNGGHLVPNGATDADLQDFITSTPNPVPGGPSEGLALFNDGTIITPEMCFNYQQQWLTGEVHLTLSNLGKSKIDKMLGISGPRVGIAAGAIAAIISAVVAAVVAIATIVIKVVEMTSEDVADGANIPQQDYPQMGYYTPDGCYIQVAPDGSNKKCCPNGTCTNNVNLSDPNNMPVDGGDPNRLSSTPWLLIGGGVLLAAAAFMSGGSKNKN